MSGLRQTGAGATTVVTWPSLTSRSEARLSQGGQGPAAPADPHRPCQVQSPQIPQTLQILQIPQATSPHRLCQ